LDGEVTISKRKKLHSLIDFVTENVVLVKLGVGKYFGETALESQEGLRTATATASKPSNLLSLNRSAYQTILLELKLLLRGAVRRTLSSPSSIFHHISPDTIERLSELVVIRTFGLQDEIFSAGRKVNNLMVVKTGIVKLIKSVPKNQVEGMIQAEEERFSNPTSADAFTNLSRPTTPATSLMTAAGAHSLSSRSSPSTTLPNSKLTSPRSRKIAAKAVLPSTNRSSISPKKSRVVCSADDSGSLKSPLTVSLPSPSPSSSIESSPGKLFRPKNSPGSSSQSQQNETPLGYWVLTRSDTYVETSRLRRIGEHPSRSAPEEQVDFTIAVLMPGQVCGETALLDPEFPSPISAVAATAVELYCFDSELLVALGIHRDQQIMNCLMDDWKFRNPPQHEILKQLRERFKWGKKKENIMKSMKPK
jgi:CRP-like cAMP-binding protein